MSKLDARTVLLLSKMDGLRYPAIRQRTVGGIEVVGFPLEYVEDLLGQRQNLMDEFCKDSTSGAPE